jgi:hypothetical protein
VNNNDHKKNPAYLSYEYLPEAESSGNQFSLL